MARPPSPSVAVLTDVHGSEPSTPDATTRVGPPPSALTRFTSSQFEVSVVASTPPTVHVVGRLSAATAPVLATVLDGQLAEGHVHLRLELSGLTQVTAAGLVPLASCRRRCRELGGRASVHGIRASHVSGLRPRTTTLALLPGGAR